MPTHNPQRRLQDAGCISSLRYHITRSNLRLSETGMDERRRCRSPSNLSTIDDQPTGGARRDRTDDLMLAKHALSQLSYGPEANATHSPTARQLIRKANGRKRQPQAAKRQRHIMVGLGGLEPPTSRLSSARSNQLSYKPEPWTRERCSPGPVTGLVREERETKTAVSRSIGLTGRVVPSVPIEEQALLEEHP